MNFFSRCSMYRRLKLLSEDGRTSRRQQRFVESHETDCEECRIEHALTMSALEGLRAEAIEPNDDPGFEARFIRRWRVERRARAVSYWLPAVAGAFIASAALLAVLQILFASPVPNGVDTRGKEASLDLGSGIAIPDYGETVGPDDHR